MAQNDFLKQLNDYQINRESQKSGFFPLPKQTQSPLKDLKDICRDNEHNPPSHLHIPQGQGYKHICPTCGYTQIVIPPQITM
jgi:hypothetical protein